MTTEEKISLIENTIEAENLKPDMVLNHIDMWDSMGRLSLIIMFDQKFHKIIAPETIASFKTVGDILNEMSE